MTGCGVDPPRPRERIIATARDLFRRHGIRGIGVDAIAEAADTNKMTLYRHFGSKDELVVACLRALAGEADALWSQFERDHPGEPLAQLHAWVRAGAECVGSNSRGCDMANVAIRTKSGGRPDRLDRFCGTTSGQEAQDLTRPGGRDSQVGRDGRASDPGAVVVNSRMDDRRAGSLWLEGVVRVWV